MADDPFLQSSFRTRLRAGAGTLIAEPDDTAVTVAGGALRLLREHRLARLYLQRYAAAEMAVRLLRSADRPSGVRPVLRRCF